MTDTLHVKIESTEQFFEDAAEAASRIESGEADGERHVLSLPDEEALDRVLSAKNLELIRTIASEEPGSVRELSRLVDRDIKNVSTALNELEDLGLIRFDQDGSAKQPRVWFDEISIDIRVAPIGRKDSGTAPA